MSQTNNLDRAVKASVENQKFNTERTRIISHNVKLRLVCDSDKGIKIPSHEFADDVLAELYRLAAWLSKFENGGRYYEKYRAYLVDKVEKSADPDESVTLNVSENDACIAIYKIDVKGWQKVTENEK
jgi:hypothetical protein